MAAILGPVRYAAANAALRARLANLLSPDQWHRILAASDLGELVGLLGGTTAYGELLESIVGEEAPEPEQVERLLWAALSRAFRVPLTFMQGTPRDLMEWLWRRFELQNLKTIIRTVAVHLPPQEIRAALIPLGSASNLPWDALTTTSSVSEVVERLHATFYGSRYARALEQALDRYKAEGEIFVLEVSLDLAYYRRLLKIINNLSGRDQQDAEKFIGTQVDSQNLLWAVRYRVFFDFSPEEILAYTLQRNLRVNAAVVQRLATGASLLVILRQLWSDRLPDLDRLTDLSPPEALPELELIFQRYLYQIAKSELPRYPFHLGTVLAYEILLESEVRDLIIVIEGKAAGWSQDQIQSRLIGARG